MNGEQHKEVHSLAPVSLDGVMPKQNKSEGRDSAAKSARELAQRIEDELEAQRAKESLKPEPIPNRDDPGMELT